MCVCGRVTLTWCRSGGGNRVVTGRVKDRLVTLGRVGVWQWHWAWDEGPEAANQVWALVGLGAGL